jgi:hypothetical protein
MSGSRKKGVVKRMPIYWAGKSLTSEEELSLRRTVALLRRLEEAGATDGENDAVHDDRRHLELFLPENIHKWSPDELELAAHQGPWFEVGEAAVG